MSTTTIQIVCGVLAVGFDPAPPHADQIARSFIPAAP